ncbi:hypothetical protein W04_1129 [Pseudoalteromonas sp. SW0106-04]|nr:hypothetical protein W04_1129 [Pseudoalteromonas sp. SW0106-04]
MSSPEFSDSQFVIASISAPNYMLIAHDTLQLYALYLCAVKYLIYYFLKPNLNAN